nr:uncharacterized protein LOC113739762 isoform X1 [Coffea arabica]
MHGYLPWSHPLPSLLDTSEHVIAKKQRMQCQRVASAMKPDFVQDIADALSFYEIFTQENQHNFSVPKFVSFFIHSDKTPLVTLRTGNKTITVGMRRRQFTTNWNTFTFEHQLQFGDALVFIPKTKSCYTVLIFDKRGVEKLFPWYNKFCIFSDAPTSAT